MAKASFTPKIGDAAVQARTGKTWAQWFTLLDRAGCKKMAHKEIVACLDDYEIGGWWQQMVTVTYEQARGLRDVHEKSDGFSASVSRTMAVPRPALFAAWDDALHHGALLNGTITVRKATRNKSLRLRWNDASSVEVNFYEKGKARSQVTVQHNKLPGAREVARMKKFWSAVLDSLQQVLTPV